MKPAMSAPGGRRGILFWRAWEKIWWLLALGFLGANAWGAKVLGWKGLAALWAAGFALLGAGILLYAWHARRRALESLSWLPVEANILRSEVSKVVQRSFSDHAGTYSSYTTSYYPEVEYEYEVQGRRYSSSRILMVRVNYPAQEAHAVAARYPAGARVRAWCDPRHHRRAVLEPGLAGYEGKYRIPILVGGSFLALGAGAWIVLARWSG